MGITAAATALGFALCSEPDINPNNSFQSRPSLASLVNPNSSHLCDIVEGTEGSAISTSDEVNIHFAPHQAQGHKTNSLENNTLTIFYGTNSWRLMWNDNADLESFLRPLRGKNITFVVEGHADYRGTSEWNDQLSENRAQGVLDKIKGYLPKAEVQVAWYGARRPSTEQTNLEALAENRRVSITADQNVIQRGLTLLPSDKYLIDGSGSMGGSNWASVQNYVFGDSQVAVFNDQGTCTSDLQTQIPQGQTPLFPAMYEMLERMNDGESLTVLTDGHDTSGKYISLREPIMSLAAKKNITLSFIGVGLDIGYQNQLQELAQSSGGGTYFGE